MPSSASENSFAPLLHALHYFDCSSHCDCHKHHHCHQCHYHLRHCLLTLHLMTSSPPSVTGFALLWLLSQDYSLVSHHPPSYFSAPTWQVASKSETTDTTRTWWKEQEEGKQQIIFESRCFHVLTSHIVVVMALQHFTPIFRKHDKLSRHSKKNWTNTWFDESSRRAQCSGPSPTAARPEARRSIYVPPSPTTKSWRPLGAEGQDPVPEWNPAETTV